MPRGKKKFKKIQLITAIIGGSFFVLTPIFSAHAAGPFQYQLLEAFPGFFAAGASTDLPTFILDIYKFGIWTVGIAGLFMLTIGGFMYMASAGNTATASKAKGVIEDAIIGIIAAMCAYLLLYVINPDLTNLKIAFTPVVVMNSPSFGGTSGGGATTTAGNAGTGTGAGVITAAEIMKQAGCNYCDAGGASGKGPPLPTGCVRNSCSGSSAWTDCSDFVSTSYTKAGCKSPCSVAKDCYSKAQPITSQSALKTGDVIAMSHHVVMCMNDGCTMVIGASNIKNGIKIADSINFYITKEAGKVVPVANYCK